MPAQYLNGCALVKFFDIVWCMIYINKIGCDWRSRHSIAINMHPRIIRPFLKPCCKRVTGARPRQQIFRSLITASNFEGKYADKLVQRAKK